MQKYRGDKTIELMLSASIRSKLQFNKVSINKNY